MRINTLPLIIVSVMVVLAACDQGGSDGHMMGDGMMGSGMMGRVISGDTTSSLPDSKSQGAILFRRFCGQCHKLPTPTAHTAGEWPKVVLRMKQYMVRQGKAVPNQNQIDEITAYLQRHAE